jgi:hypothetical protein
VKIFQPLSIRTINYRNTRTLALNTKATAKKHFKLNVTKNNGAAG